MPHDLYFDDRPAGTRRIGHYSLRRAICGAGLLVHVLIGLPHYAAAAALRDDEALIQQGIEARQKNEDAKALGLFQKAYQLRPDERTLAQIALAEFALGDWLNAEVHIQKALESGTHPWIAKHRALLQDSLEKIQNELGTLHIVGTPDGAEVLIEGHPKARLPMEGDLRVRAGECSIELRAPGYVSARRTVTVTSRRQSTETIHLAPELPVPGPARSDVPGESPITTRQADRSHENTGARLRIGGATAAGVGVAAIGSGLIFGWLARSASDQNQATGHAFDPDLDRRGKAYETWQYVGIGVGAVLIIGGGIAYWLGIEPPQGQRVAISVAPQVGVQAGWEFSF